MKYLTCLLTLCTLFAVTSARSILDYNVTLGRDISVDDEFKNARALERAFEDANNHATDREVWIPEDTIMSMMPTYMKNLTNVSLRVNGTLLQSKNWVQYPSSNDDDSHYDALLWFQRCDGILIEGTGTIDGQGFMWWIREILQKNLHTRPYIIRYHLCRNLELRDVLILNSPYYHIVPYDCENIYMHDFEIFVDIWGQLELHRLFSYKYGIEKTEVNGFTIEMPIFPLNTDGIDVWAKNATFRRVKITNFDDSIVPKPCNQGYEICKCTENILIEDCETVYTVGMTIGSVPPSTNHACIKDVIFRNIYMNQPIKGIYIKPNPGDNGDGLIQNITYENFVMDTPIWWGVWIGPQQQYQPGWSGNAGCSMTYPWGKCDTYKAVTMDNIVLRNITSTNSLLPAGVILCNDTNPCTNFHFEDVNLRTPLWDSLGYGWFTQYVEGTTLRVFPDPKFKPTGYYASLREEDKVDEAAEIQKMFTAESMMSHLIDGMFSVKYGQKFTSEQYRLQGLGLNSEILDVIQ